MYGIIMDNPPKLSVIVIVRNSVATIARTLDSLAAQHYPNLEVIVWDGFSDDGTVEVIRKYSSLVTVLKSELDNGPPDAYNKALKLATGDYVAFLNGDDEYEPGVLWAVADSIAKQPDAEVVSFGIIYRTTDRHGHLKVTGYYADERQLSMTLNYILRDNQTFFLSRFIKRSLFAEIGQFNSNRTLWYYSNDREWLARLAVRGCSNVVIPKALYGYSFSKKSHSINPDNYARIIEEHIMIAEQLLARKDLNEGQAAAVKKWQRHQLAFGFWQSLISIKIDKAETFLKQGLAIAGWKFIILSLYLLLKKVIKKLGLKLSCGIDRGTV